jgi:hypothetical protein
MGSWLAWSAATSYWLHVDDVVVADVEAHVRVRHGVVRRERAQRARRQRIVFARGGGAGAARHDLDIMRLNHVLTFEQQKSTLAWCKQTLSACMLSQGTVTCMALVAFLFLFGSVILLAFARRRAEAETGLARTYKAYC